MTVQVQEATKAATPFMYPTVSTRSPGRPRTSVITDSRTAPADEVPLSMVERMTLIMESFVTSQARLTLEQITSCTGLPRSTVHRILDQLVRLAWLDRRGRDYTLGGRALTLGGLDAVESSLRASASPILQTLAARTDMVVHLVVLDGAEVRYLDKVGQARGINVPSRVGGRMPAHCTAAGKSMLACLPPEQVDALFAAGVPARTARTIGNLPVLHQELGRIRSRNRLAFERAECTPHISCVGAAVRGPDGPIGAISLAGDLRAPLERLAPLVLNAVQAVARAVGSESRREGAERQSPPCSPFDDTLDRLVAMAECGEWQ